MRGSPGSMAINSRKEASLACRVSSARLSNGASPQTAAEPWWCEQEWKGIRAARSKLCCRPVGRGPETKDKSQNRSLEDRCVSPQTKMLVMSAAFGRKAPFSQAPPPRNSEPARARRQQGIPCFAAVRGKGRETGFPCVPSPPARCQDDGVVPEGTPNARCACAAVLSSSDRAFPSRGSGGAGTQRPARMRQSLPYSPRPWARESSPAQCTGGGAGKPA